MRIRFGPWRFDSETHELGREGKRVHVTPKAFRLLEILIAARPAALSKDELTEALWPSTFVAESNLASVMKELRSVLEDDARNPQWIRTVFSFGYAFIGQVEEEPRSQPRPVESIAVLPFANDGGAESQHVSDGLTEFLVDGLSRLQRSHVVPYSSVIAYTKPAADWRATARRLGVGAVVTGSVSMRAGTLTVDVRLLDVDSESQLWGERFSRPRLDLQSVQSDIVAAISDHLQPAASSRTVRPARPNQNPEAYDHYLRGRLYLTRRDADGFRRAIEQFHAATEIDPSYGAAFAALAETYVALGSRDVMPPVEIFPKAKAMAVKAVSLDSCLASAHSALGGVSELFEWNWQDAERHHRAAIDLDPNNANAVQWLALHYARRGLHDEAKPLIERALELEPLAAILMTNAFLVAYLRRDYEAALKFADDALDLHPRFEGALLARGVVLTQTDPAGAVRVLEDAANVSSRQPYTLSNLGFAYAAVGRHDEARKLSAEIAGRAPDRHVSGADLAIIEVALGNPDHALDHFEVAAENKSPWLTYLKTEPRLDVLRDEPRFQRLISRIAYV